MDAVVIDRAVSSLFIIKKKVTDAKKKIKQKNLNAVLKKQITKQIYYQNWLVYKLLTLRYIIHKQNTCW